MYTSSTYIEGVARGVPQGTRPPSLTVGFHEDVMTTCWGTIDLFFKECDPKRKNPRYATAYEFLVEVLFIIYQDDIWALFRPYTETTTGDSNIQWLVA